MFFLRFLDGKFRWLMRLAIILQLLRRPDVAGYTLRIITMFQEQNQIT
jgi:hypothetical protein